MAYKNLNLFIIILILLVNKVVDGQKFIPGPRIGQSATLLGGKIYYIGGFSLSAVDLTGGDFFYLDEKFTWVDLKSQGVKFPVSLWHTSDIGGANQDSIFIIGGFQLGNTNLVYRFDTTTNAITIPIIQGLTPPKRENMRSVSYGGKIYLLGGRLLNNGVNTFFSRLDILDTVTMNWQVGSYINGPIPRYYYTATIVNGVIYYIGGMRQYSTTTRSTYVLMSAIYRYNIDANTWTYKIATSAKTLPGQRIGHSAVLVDGKICIYGGTYFPKGALRAMPSTEQIAMLDPTTLVWSIPPLQDPNIPSLVHHTATLTDNFMLIAFGNITDLSGGPVYNDKFYIFDFREPNIRWYGFTALDIGSAKSPQSPIKAPTASKSTGTAKAGDSPQSSSPSKSVIIGLSVGLVSIGLAGIVGFLFVYKRIKKNENVPAGESDHPGHPGVSDGQIHQQQFPQVASQYQHLNSQQDSYYSRTSTLTQSQGYSPGQEFSTLPPPGFFKHSSNYFPGSETLPSNYSHGNHGSETPPPPPPKTPQPAYNIHGTDHQPFY